MRLDLPHMAFLRAVVNGLDVLESFDRYLLLAYDGCRLDERIARRTLRELREACARVALRRGRPGTARLLRMDVLSITAPRPAQAPSLEEFAETNDLEDYREAEIVRLWTEAYGGTAPGKALAARGRLIARQLIALREIEELAAARPKLEDPVDSWFSSRIANRLKEHGIATIYSLLKRMQRPHWHSALAGIGSTKAARLEEFARQWDLQLPKTGLAALPPAIAAEQQGSMPILAQGFGAILAVLDQPAPAGNVVGAATQADALRAFLSRYSGHTLRAYRREVERLLLWATVARRKPITAFTRDDVVAYREFLHDPQPRENWCAPRSIPRSSAAWRPLEGPLSDASLGLAMSIVSKLFSFLAQGGLMPADPAMHMPKAGRSNLRQQFGRRLLDHDDLALLQQHAGNGARGQRAALLLDFLYATGLRISEAAAATFEHVMPLGDGFMLGVVGKGNKYREVPVPAEVIERARAMAHERGVLSAEEGRAHLFGPVESRNAQLVISPYVGLKPGLLARDVKEAAERAASSIRAEDPKRAARLLKASAHWLRHTHASHSLEAGVDLVAVQANLGHSSLATTSVYATAEQRRRLDQMRNFWKSRG